MGNKDQNESKYYILGDDDDYEDDFDYQEEFETESNSPNCNVEDEDFPYITDEDELYLDEYFEGGN